MLEFLEPMKNDNFDFISFFDSEKEGTILVSGQLYKNPGEPIEETELGKKYHIILFQSHETEDKYINLDSFEAILLDPLEYISQLIPSGFCGIVAKKTTTSVKFVNKLLDFCRKRM